MPRTVRTAPLTVSPTCRPCRTAPAPVITFGSFSPSPSQSNAPSSTTIVPLPASVLAPELSGKTAPTSPALPCRLVPNERVPTGVVGEYARLAGGGDPVIAEHIVAYRYPGKESRPDVRQPDPIPHGSAKLVPRHTAVRQARRAQAVAPRTDDHVVGDDDAGGARRSDAALAKTDGRRRGDEGVALDPGAVDTGDIDLQLNSRERPGRFEVIVGHHRAKPAGDEHTFPTGSTGPAVVREADAFREEGRPVVEPGQRTVARLAGVEDQSIHDVTLGSGDQQVLHTRSRDGKQPGARCGAGDGDTGSADGVVLGETDHTLDGNHGTGRRRRDGGAKPRLVAHGDRRRRRTSGRRGRGERRTVGRRDGALVLATSHHDQEQGKQSRNGIHGRSSLSERCR